MMGEFSGKDLYQIKITLVDSKPLIWRRLIVPKIIPLDELHMVIQLAMGWTNSHMYGFEKGNLVYGMIIDDHEEPYLQDSTGVPLNKLLRKKGEEIVYVYDFGDNWDHCILLEESSLPDQELPHLPICIKERKLVRLKTPVEFGGTTKSLKTFRMLTIQSEKNYTSG